MESEEALLLAARARAFGGDPSSRLTISDPVVAYALDDALFHRLIAAQPSKPGAEKLPPGTRYESVSDLGRPLWDEARARRRNEAFTAKLIREGRMRVPQGRPA